MFIYIFSFFLYSLKLCFFPSYKWSCDLMIMWSNDHVTSILSKASTHTYIYIYLCCSCIFLPLLFNILSVNNNILIYPVYLYLPVSFFFYLLKSIEIYYPFFLSSSFHLISSNDHVTLILSKVSAYTCGYLCHIQSLLWVFLIFFFTCCKYLLFM